jgi:hypothetical protein
MDLARAPRRTARKKGSGYENAHAHAPVRFGTIRMKWKTGSTRNKNG